MAELKTVPKAEFDAFIASYPRKLLQNMHAVGTPAFIGYYDETLQTGEPFSGMVARKTLMSELAAYDGVQREDEFQIARWSASSSGKENQ